MKNIDIPIEVPHLSAYAEDPRSYCHYRGIPRSIHNKQPKVKARRNPLSSPLSRNLLYIVALFLLISGIFLYVLSKPPGDILGITIETEIIKYCSAGSFLLAIILWIIRSYFIKRSLFKFCGVPTSNYKLLGTSLKFPKHSIKLIKNKIHGTPTTIFMKSNGKTAFVCQYNQRDFKRRAKVRERYQMLLFMGMVMEKYKLEDIKGAIRYHDHLEFIKHEPIIYNKLLDLQEEYSEAIQEWVTPDERPLFKRDKTF